MEERMSNELITMNSQLAVPENGKVTLLDIRKDSKRFPRLGTYPREQAIFVMSKIVSQAFLFRGQAADETNIRFIACSLVDELQSDLDKMGTNNISFEEISRIVKRAILTDDIYGISVASLYKVIISYVKGEGHQLNKQVMEERRKAEDQSIKNSIIAPMLQAYAGAMVKNSKR